MGILMLMIPMALIFGAGFVLLFLWATKSGQFDDVHTPAMRIFDDDQNVNKSNITTGISNESDSLEKTEKS